MAKELSSRTVEVSDSEKTRSREDILSQDVNLLIRTLREHIVFNSDSLSKLLVLDIDEQEVSEHVDAILHTASSNDLITLCERLFEGLEQKLGRLNTADLQFLIKTLADLTRYMDDASRLLLTQVFFGVIKNRYVL